MKWSLIRMIFRRYRKIMISLVMIAALAIVLLNGMFNAWLSLDQTMKTYLSEYGIADAVISTEPTGTDQAAILQQVKGIRMVIPRVSGSSQLRTADGKLLTAQIISMDKEDILRIYPWEEAGDQTGDYVYADSWFARKNGISVGDTLQIRTGEDEYRPFRVAAVVSAPETLERTKMSSGGSYYPDFGFLYAPISLLEEETREEKLRKTEEWKTKETEYLQTKQETEETLASGQEELNQAWEELEKQEKEFDEKQTELKEQIQELTEHRFQLMMGRKELEDAEETVEERETQLKETLTETTQQLLETEDAIAELTEARNDINSLTVQMEINKGRFSVRRTELEQNARTLRNVLGYLHTAKNQLQSRGSDLLDEIPEEYAGLRSEAEEILNRYGISYESLDSWIYRVNSGIQQLEGGSRRIQDGIAQINREYLPELQSYLEQTEQGLETAYEVQEALQDGIAQIETGLKSIDDFKQEAPGQKEEINQILGEVEEGLQEIYSSIEEAEKGLSESRATLEEKNAEAEETRAEAEEKLEESGRTLQEAWDELNSWEGYTPIRNEFLVWLDEDVTDRRALLKAAQEVLEVPVLNSELYDDSRVAEIIRGNLEPLWATAVMVPMLFVAIMMVVLFLFLSIMIRQSRQAIGILRALGITRGQVRGAFAAACVLLMLAASVFGEGVSFLLTEVFNRYYQRFFPLPLYVDAHSGLYFGLSSSAFVLLALCAVALSTRSVSRIQPAEAFARTVSGAPKIGRFLRMMLRHAHPMTRFSLLSLKRNPFRVATSVICISGAVSIIFAALSYIVAKNELLSEVFDRQLLYDAQIVFAEEPENTVVEKLGKMEQVTAANRYWIREETISAGEKAIRGNLMFLENGTPMISLKDTSGIPLKWPAEGIVLCDRFAENLGVKAGDTVTVGNVEEKVAAVAHQQAMEFQFLPASEMDRFLQMEQTGLLIHLREGADGQELTNQLYQEKGYVTVLWKTLMRQGFQDNLDQFDLFAWMLVSLCVAVGVFIVVNTGRNNLHEQSLSLSILRAIGFQRHEISVRWFLQMLLYLISSLLIGFPMGWCMAVKGLELMSTPMRRLEYFSSAYQYAWTVVCTFVFILVGHWITMRSMRKWNLVENTKGRE